MKSIRNIISLLPPLEECNTLKIEGRSVLVTVGGFEDRTLAAAKISSNSKSGRVLILKYKPFIKRNRLNDVITTLKNKGFLIEDDDVIEFDRFNPEVFTTFFQNRLKEIDAQKIILDISAMSKLALLLCLKACWELNFDTSIFYAEAVNKGPKKEDFEKAKNKDLRQPSIQIYTGIHGVIRVSGLSSVAMQGQPSAAIVFMSFNELLTQALLDSVYPSRLFLINSRSPKWKWREEAIAWIHEQLRSEWSSSDNQIDEQSENGKKLPKRVVSTFDYRETISVLLELYWKLSIDHRILLAPTGSKLQTLGCFFVKALHPDIHIEYPTPEGFLDTYSQGIDKTWLVKFGHLKDKTNVLRTEERKSLLGIDAESNAG